AAAQEDLGICSLMEGTPVIKSVAVAAVLFRDYEGNRYWPCCAGFGPLFYAEPQKYFSACTTPLPGGEDCPRVLPSHFSFDRSSTMPAKKHVLVLGAGAAGSSAAQVLAQHEDIATTAIAATETAPYNRTLVNKAVATGLIDAKQAHMPLLPTTTIRDSAEVIFPKHQHVELRSGTQLDYDAVIVATGSTPRPLPAGIAGPGTLESGLLTHLHS